MKKILITFVFTLFLLLTACNNDNDKEILAFFDEWDNVVKIMLQKIEAGDVDGARAVFDAHKENLKSGWRKIPRSRSGRSGTINMSSAVKKRYLESFSPNLYAITNTFITFENKFGKDKTKVEKLRNLNTEYREIFR